MLAILLMLAKFAVPLFIFITGMVLFYNTGESFHYGSFMRKRVMDVIVPYVVWSLLYFMLTPQNWTGFGWRQIPDLGLKLITGKMASHFWYIIMLIQFYLFFPLFLRVVRYVFHRYQAKGQMIALPLSGGLFLILANQLRSILCLDGTASNPGADGCLYNLCRPQFYLFLFYFVPVRQDCPSSAGRNGLFVCTGYTGWCL